jgi:hypothetical protein
VAPVFIQNESSKLYYLLYLQVKAKERLNSQLTGPKPFPLERMLAIFYNIVDVSILLVSVKDPGCFIPDPRIFSSRILRPIKKG